MAQPTSNKPEALIEVAAMLAADSNFSPDSKTDDNIQYRREQGLGIALNVWAGYDGTLIMRVAAYALEDANFHSVAAALRKMLSK